MGKTRPIIFSVENAKAILDGRKTMTRRVIVSQPKIVHALYNDGTIETEQLFRSGKRIKCPHGEVGDRLWVREACYKDTLGDWRYKAGEALLPMTANYTNREVIPSIFMPRWASRLTLEITGVRVERLQDITEEDAVAEGIKLFRVGMPPHQVSVFAMEYPTPLVGDTAISGYRFLWNSINAKWKRLWNRELKIYEFWQFPWCAEDAKPIPKTAKYPERYHCVPNPWCWGIKFDNIGVRVK